MEGMEAMVYLLGAGGVKEESKRKKKEEEEIHMCMLLCWAALMTHYWQTFFDQQSINVTF